MQSIIGKEYPIKVIPLIDAAKQSIKIIVYDWRWYPNEPGNPAQLFNQSIVRANRRGVEVKVISNVQDVIAILKSQGCDARRPTTSKMIHAKMILIDDKILVLGSHNFTQSAFTMNYEISLILDDEQPLDNFINFFNNLYNNYV